MYQYYIIEIQKNAAGEYGHLIHWAYDADPDQARLKAEAKYHEILSYAATSQTLSHSATILSGEGFPVMHQCYKHDVPAPTPEPEPETEGEGGDGE